MVQNSGFGFNFIRRHGPIPGELVSRPARSYLVPQSFKLKLLKRRRSYGRSADRALALWVKLARASSTFGRLTKRHIHSFGLTEPQFSALECLGHLGPLTLGVLSRKMLVSGGNVTCVVGHLERDGLVERVHTRGDRRKVVAKLTPKGGRLFAATFPGHASYVGEVASVLEPRDQEELSRLLRKLGLGLAGAAPAGRINTNTKSTATPSITHKRTHRS
jgi:MarR family 2-MHQ and catechol resistance regulon transcriptional repressor